MAGSTSTTKVAAEFADIEIPPGLTRNNFFFLYLNIFFAGMLMSVLELLQPAFLIDSIKINHDFARSINWLLINLNDISTLALVAMVGILSLKGRITSITPQEDWSSVWPCAGVWK